MPDPLEWLHLLKASEPIMDFIFLAGAAATFALTAALVAGCSRLEAPK